MYKIDRRGESKNRSLGLKPLNARKILRNFNFEAVYTLKLQLTVTREREEKEKYSRLR